MDTTKALSDRFLEALEISITELAALRGVSRQYATRDIGKFLNNADGLSDLCRTLLVINTDSSRVMAERLKKFAAEQLQLEITVGSTVSTASSKTYAQVFAENKELWVWSASPLDMERAGFWEKLCSEFLDKEGRLLAYFVPTLEIADRLALRFENELLGREFDDEGSPISGALSYGATVFIVVTQLAAAMPYVVLANPGSADFAREGLPQTILALGKQGQDFFELPTRFGDQLVHKVRSAGLGVARTKENFFPMGMHLTGESGIPFGSYPNVDHLVATRLDFSVGLFDGLVDRSETQESNSETKGQEQDDNADSRLNEQRRRELKHPLKFFPVFIRAYRKKSGESAKKKRQAKGVNPANLFEF